jgi:hypothetical protein
MIGMSTKDNEEKVTHDTQKQRHKLRYAFWEAALERLRADGVDIYRNISPARGHWLGAGSGVRSCPYQMIFSRDEARVELNFGRSEASENKWLFDQLFAQKDQLEARFGAPLVWRRMDDNKQSLIVYSQPFDGFNRDPFRRDGSAPQYPEEHSRLSADHPVLPGWAGFRAGLSAGGCRGGHAMTGSVDLGPPSMAYLDQNVLSRLREGEPGSDLLRDALNKMGAQGVVFVYSMIHVEESRASGRSEAFVEALSAISAWYIESQAHDGRRVALSAGRAEELLLADRDLLHEASRTMENLLKPMQFAMGWLDGVDETSLREELVEGVNEFWDALEMELPEENRIQLTGGKRAMLDSISVIPLEKVRGEAEVSIDRIRARLPENYAQLDAIPVDQIVEFLAAG